MTTKRCTKCGQEKPVGDFGRDARARDGLHQHCLQCKRDTRKRWREEHPEDASAQFRAWSDANRTTHLARTRRWQAANREKMWNSMLRSRYGITLEDYRRLHEAQGGRCKICGGAAKLVVDHRHDGDGSVRGLLCSPCNTAIGLLRENLDILRSAMGYLTIGQEYDVAAYTVEVQVRRRGPDGETGAARDEGAGR